MRAAFATLITVALALSAGPADAQPDKRADALNKEGNALARAGKYTEAIAKYKASQHLARRWKRWCNIGFAYQKLKRLHQAEWFLRLCSFESGGSLPARAKLGARLATIRAALKQGAYAQVRINVTPARARVYSDAYAKDEPLPAGKALWVPVGQRQFRVQADGMKPRRLTLAVTKSHAVTTRSVTLEPIPNTQPETKQPETKQPETKQPPVITRPLPPPSRDTDTVRRPVGGLTWALLSVGVVGLAGGGIFHAVALRTKNDAESLPKRQKGEAYPEFDAKVSSFEKQRVAAVGLYVVGGAAMGLAVYRLLTRQSKAESTTAIGPVLTPRGAAVMARWSW